MIKCKKCKSIFDKQYLTNRPSGSPYKGHVETLLTCPLCSSIIDNFELKRTTKGSELLDDCSNYDKYAYEPFLGTTDNLIVNIVNGKAKVLVIERAANPFKGLYALPGGFIDQTDSDASVCAVRELKEETDLVLNDFFQFKTYASKNRDPRGYVISIVYATILHNADLKVTAQDDASAYKWIDIDSEETLAFDHNLIINDFRDYFRNHLIANDLI